MSIQQVEHHGKLVWADQANVGTHRANCLCYKGCRHFKPDARDNCAIAQVLYDFCVLYSMVTPVFECASYGPVEPVASP